MANPYAKFVNTGQAENPYAKFVQPGNPYEQMQPVNDVPSAPENPAPAVPGLPVQPTGPGHQWGEPLSYPERSVQAAKAADPWRELEGAMQGTGIGGPEGAFVRGARIGAEKLTGKVFGKGIARRAVEEAPVQNVAGAGGALLPQAGTVGKQAEEIAQARWGKAFDALEQWQKEQIGQELRMRPESLGRMGNLPISPEAVAGRGAKEDLRKAYFAAKGNVSKMFKSAQAMPGSNVPVEAKGFWDSVRGSMSSAIMSHLPQETKEVLSRVSKIAKPTINDLEEVRRSLMKAYRAVKDPETRIALLKMRGAYDDEVLAVGDSAAARAYNQAFKARRTMGIQYEGRDLIGKLVAGGKVSAVPDSQVALRMVTGVDGEANLRLLKDSLAQYPGQFQKLVGATLYAIGKRATVVTKDGPRVDPVRFVNSINKLGETKLRLMFGDEGYDAFIKITKMAGKMSTKDGSFKKYIEHRLWYDTIRHFLGHYAGAGALSATIALGAAHMVTNR